MPARAYAAPRLDDGGLDARGPTGRADRPTPIAQGGAAIRAARRRSRDVAEGIPYGVRLAAAWSWRLLLIGGVIAVIIFLIIQLRLIVIPILVAVLIGALLVPFSGFLQRHGWPKWLAVTRPCSRRWRSSAVC